MIWRCLRLRALGLAPIALAACADPGPKMGQASPAPVVAADLGTSSRVAKIAGLVGEGEFYGTSRHPAEPAAHAAMTRSMDHGSMDHGSMGHDSADPAAAPPASAPGLSSAPAKTAPAGQPARPAAKSSSGVQLAHSGHAHARGTGTVNSVDPAARKINMTHDPIPAIGWPTMTMDFAVAPAVDLNAVRPGTRINFEMEQGQGGMYVIQSITPAAAPSDGRRR